MGQAADTRKHRETLRGGAQRALQGGDLPQRVAAHGRRPAYHGTSHATGGTPWQQFSLVSAAFATAWFATDCHRLQPRGSI